MCLMRFERRPADGSGCCAYCNMQGSIAGLVLQPESLLARTGMQSSTANQADLGAAIKLTHAHD
jgi:hypothetical protein